MIFTFSNDQFSETSKINLDPAFTRCSSRLKSTFNSFDLYIFIKIIILV